jgi:hypothetical protein
MTRPEIDWGDEPKTPKWESDEARRVRQAKHARGMEFQAAAQRALALQSAARAGQPGAELAYANQPTLIQNVQGQIQNTITNENHDVAILTSLNDRLAKARLLRDQAAAALKAGGGMP